MIRPFLIGIGALILIVVFSPVTHACYCLIPDVPNAYANASAVFEGEVVEITNPSTFDEKARLPGSYFVIRFKVRKSWKGPPADELSILSAQGNYSCFAFPAVNTGERYLVYADAAFSSGVEHRNWLVITSCNRTALIPDNSPVLTEIFSSEFDRSDGSRDLGKLDSISCGAPLTGSIWKNPCRPDVVSQGVLSLPTLFHAR